jgi:hypothetical protein
VAKGRKTGGADWGKGISGNVEGRPKLAEEIKQIRKLTAEEIVGTFSKYLGMTQEEMVAIDRKKLSLLEVWMLKAAELGIKAGNYFILDKILDRVIGKSSMGIRVEEDNRSVIAGERLEEIINILKSPRRTEELNELTRDLVPKDKVPEGQE